MIGDGETDDAIGTQAAHWFAVMRGPDADARRAEFDTWRASDPRRAEAYDEVANLFAIAASATRTPVAKDADQDSNAARPRSPALARYAIAAGLAAVIAVGTLTWTHRAPTEDAPAPAVIANDGPARIQRLGDGSIVLLGAASLITANLSAAVREIRLDQGRARFIVAHDRSRDFVVIGRGRTITARSAVFDVAMTGDETHVSVAAGEVEILGEGNSGVRTIMAGQSVTLGGENSAAITSTAAPDWPPARAEFEGAPLADVVRIANGFGAPPIVLAAQDLGTLRLTGTFDIRDTAPLARKIAAALDLDIAIGPSEIRLSRRH